jgi:hypothetical protein
MSILPRTVTPSQQDVLGALMREVSAIFRIRTATERIFWIQENILERFIDCFNMRATRGLLKVRSDSTTRS